MEAELDSDVCLFCDHIIDMFDRTCKAFPEGIPKEIWYGKNRHLSPYPGDHGYQYKWMGGKAVRPEWMDEEGL